jgi:hypothetical protein
VVLAVGSAMLSSVQKILQNRALNRVHNFDSDHENKPNVNYNPDGTIHDRLPFPKDLGAYMYDYMSEREMRNRKLKKSAKKSLPADGQPADDGSGAGSDPGDAAAAADESLLLARLGLQR